ncbi:hypothetical protein [Brevundimonas sp. Root1423]|uniref:hypothetical protein n=1 Tax=Brevundimonas sp. Root1423 TaxID=1736462 RepID=UPI0006FF6893|nr:hypothetical protein [Brevundimonas sp. Root1423]KQY75335.1 hypothetical protein ASD25_12425 [Brevundimonas sp. Root1423]
MAKRIIPSPASHSTVCDVPGLADGLAISSLDWALRSPAVIDQSLAPPGAPFAVVMSPCDHTDCKARRQAIVTEDEPADAFTDLIAPEFLSTLTNEDRRCLHVQVMPTARLAIDQVSEGVARTVEPGLEDVARVSSPELRADVMLALGWLVATCGCLRALMNSLPDDSLPGIYVRAGAELQTPGQRAETEQAEQRRRQLSQDWSVHLKAKAEARRRPPIGDLFGMFDASTATTAKPAAQPAP